MVLGENQQQQLIIVTTEYNAYPCVSIILLKDVNVIIRSACNRNQEKQALKIHTICLTDSDYDYIPDEIGSRDKIDYERKICIEDE